MYDAKYIVRQYATSCIVIDFIYFIMRTSTPMYDLTINLQRNTG